MASIYAADRAAALKDIKRAGTKFTILRRAVTSVDDSTNAVVLSDKSTTAYALALPASDRDAVRFGAGSISLASSRVLTVASASLDAAYGDPEPGDRVVDPNNDEWAVVGVAAIQPDLGPPIIHKMLVTRGSISAKQEQ